MARTRFVGTLKGLRTDSKGRMVLEVQAAPDKDTVLRATALLSYLVPRPRQFVLRVMRNDTGGVVTLALLKEWQWIREEKRAHIRLRFLLVSNGGRPIRLDTIQEQIGRQILLDTHEENED